MLKMFGVYKKRGEYHKNLDPNWSYYPIYLEKMKFVESFLKNISTKSKILDAGCGEGVVVNKFREKGYNIVGIDLNFESKFIKRGNITKLPFSNNSFDVILCLDVLEHLDFDNQDKALKEMYRVLKPGGFLLFSIPNLAHLYSRITFFLFGKLNRTSNIKRHKGDRPIGEYISLLRENKFKIIQREGIFPTYPLLFQLISKRPSKFMWLFRIINGFRPSGLCLTNLIICKKL